MEGLAQQLHSSYAGICWQKFEECEHTTAPHGRRSAGANRTLSTARRPDQSLSIFPKANHATPSRRRSVCVACNRPPSRRCHRSHDLCRCVVLPPGGRFLHRRHRTTSRRGSILLGDQPVHSIAHSADIGGRPNTVDWIYHGRHTIIYEHIWEL